MVLRGGSGGGIDDEVAPLFTFWDVVRRNISVRVRVRARKLTLTRGENRARHGETRSIFGWVNCRVAGRQDLKVPNVRWYQIRCALRALNEAALHVCATAPIFLDPLQCNVQRFRVR